MCVCVCLRVISDGRRSKSHGENSAYMYLRHMFRADEYAVDVCVCVCASSFV